MTTGRRSPGTEPVRDLRRRPEGENGGGRPAETVAPRERTTPGTRTPGLVGAATRRPAGEPGAAPEHRAVGEPRAPRDATPPPTALPPPGTDLPGSAEPLGAYLQAQATAFLRSLRIHRESVGNAELASDAADAVRRLRRSSRRIGATLHTFRPLLDPVWSEQLRTELSWLSGTLAREYTFADRLDRLLGALNRLAHDGAVALPGPATAARGGDPAEGSAGGSGHRRGGTGESRRDALPVGVARAGALLDRQLTLARTRAHSAALQALGSSRFHAVADTVAVLASEPPEPRDPGEPGGPGGRTGTALLAPYAEQAELRLQDAVDALPLARSEHPFHAEALARSLSPDVQSDGAWLQVRLLLRLHRYARELLLHGVRREHAPDPEGAEQAEELLAAAGRELDRHHQAAEAAAAAASAARTPRIAPATAYALGVLHADQRHEVEAARFAFGRHWTAADGQHSHRRRDVP